MLQIRLEFNDPLLVSAQSYSEDLVIIVFNETAILRESSNQIFVAKTIKVPMVQQIMPEHLNHTYNALQIASDFLKSILITDFILSFVVGGALSFFLSVLRYL